MKKVLTLIVAFIFAISIPTVNAQISSPPGGNMSGPVGVTVTDVTGHYYEGGANVFWDGNVFRAFSLDNRYSTRLNFPVNILDIKRKTKNPKLLLVLLPGGIVSIGQVERQQHGNTITLGWVELKRDTIGITIPTGSWTDYQGDDYYALGGGLLVVSRDSGATFQLDTAGLLTSPGDFTLDTFQNVYAVNYLGLFTQTPSGTVWSKINSYPGTGGNYLYNDRQNRLIVGAGSHVYVSGNGGTTWTSSTSGLTASVGKFGDDAFGNIYTTNGHEIFRSLDGGVTWTRIDQPITSLSADTTVYGIINGIGGDTVLYASTIWGLFKSSDQGTTWSVANQDIESAPNGFWLFNNGRMVANTALGTFVKNAGDTAWTQTYPTGGKYLNMGVIQGDTLGNIYTMLSMYGGQLTMPMISTDQGATWQPDTAGYAATNYMYGYIVDEYGSSHLIGKTNNIYYIYSKASGGSYTLDTAGISSQLPNFGLIQTFSSDRSGWLYVFGLNYSGPATWRRPITGGAWTVDTSGLGHVNINQAFPDHHGGVIAINWYGYVGLYHRDATGWKTMSYPSGIYSFTYISAMGGDPSGNLMASYYLPDYTTDVNTALGIYCTPDAGTTWNYVPGLDSVYVNRMETFGDTTYLLTTIGIYQMTCAGTIVNPTGIVVVNKEPDMIRLYPNPASGDCHLSLTSALADGGTLAISDLTGRVVKVITLSGNETTFATHDMNAGMYLCTISSDGKVIGAKKLVVN